MIRSMQERMFNGCSVHFFYVSCIRSSVLFLFICNSWNCEFLSTFWYDSLDGGSAHHAMQCGIVRWYQLRPLLSNCLRP